MARAFACRCCGVQRMLKWAGRCPGCGGFFDIKFAHADVEGAEDAGPPISEGEVVSLCDVKATKLERISTGVDGLDRILGIDSSTGVGGLAAVAGHVVQFFGSPGSGKSTLLLQVCREITKQRYNVLYIAAEETLEQIKARADRIGKFNHKMQIAREQDLDAILDAIEEHNPDVCVIDSVNTIVVEEYSPNSTQSLAVAARELTHITKERKMALILVVQINRQGDFSGPQAMEHAVDTSLFLRRTTNKERRLECSGKNRNGPTPAFAYFRMEDNGLIEIDDPNPPAEVDAPDKAPKVKADPPAAPAMPEIAPAEARPAPVLKLVPKPKPKKKPAKKKPKKKPKR